MIEFTAFASAESSRHTNIEFLGGPKDQSMLTKYANHVAYRLWQGDVYMFCLTLIYLLVILDVLTFTVVLFVYFMILTI